MSNSSQSQSSASLAPSGGTTGSICSKTGPYKASDGRIETVVLVKKGEKFPAFPGGTGTTATSWSPVGGNDSSRGGFTSVKVAAGAQ